MTVACRSCESPGLRTFLDLGETPLADALVAEDDRGQTEERFPLEVAFCERCSLVQILEEVPPEKLFVDNYLYFSSFSDALIEHARVHAHGLIDEHELGPDSLVVEIGSNDGYLLRHVADRGIPVLGIDPAPDQAHAATEAGIPTIAEFFGSALAARLRDEGRRANVIVANNVMAHTPHLNDFVAGIAALLAPDGVATVENPYVRDLIEEVEFDTIYHEHFSYYSCTSVDALVARHGLSLNRVERFPKLHGGTLRWTISPRERVEDSARDHLDRERADGLTSFAYYERFAERVEHIRSALPALLGELKAGGATIAAYGAAAKGATLVNTTGLDTRLIDFVVDRNTHKQGRYMPGVGIPVVGPEALLERRPDYTLLLAWNFLEEIRDQQSEYLRGGGRFVVPVPEPAVV